MIEIVISKLKEHYSFTITIIIILIFQGGPFYNTYFYKPQNSIELHQELLSDDFEEVQKIMAEGYEDNFQKEDYEYMNRRPTKGISQFTLIELDKKTYMFMTTIGGDRLQVLAVEELPKEIRDYFMRVGPHK